MSSWTVRQMQGWRETIAVAEYSKTAGVDHEGSTILVLGIAIESARGKLRVT